MKTLITAAVAALLPLAALAEAPGISVSDAYARSANPRSGAAFMTITNDSATDCKLTGVTTGVTDRAEMHTHTDENGVMKMGQVDAIDIPAHGTAALARGGYHIMLMALPTPLAEGETIDLMLDLGDCGSLQVPVVVEGDRKAAAPMGHQGHGMAGHTPTN